MWNYPTISIKKTNGASNVIYSKAASDEMLRTRGPETAINNVEKRPPAKYPNVVTRKKNAMLILLIYPKKNGEILICHEAMHSTIDC